MVSVPALNVNVPLPESVPLRAMPVGIVGLAPKGSKQLLPTVFVLVCPVKLTKLNCGKLDDTQAMVAVLESKVIVPPLALKAPAETFMPPATVMLPEGALKVPPDTVKAAVVLVPLKSAPLAKVNVPELRATVPELVSVPADWVTAPPLTVRPAKVLAVLERVNVPLLAWTVPEAVNEE